MQQIPYRSSSPSLLTRIVGALIAVIVLAVSMTVGFAIFLVLLGLAAITLIVFYVRLYWVRRRLVRRTQRARQESGWQGSGHSIIEGEYRVVRRRERR